MKNKLSGKFDFQEEYQVWEINTLLPDYGLSFHLNKNLGFQLKKIPDLEVFKLAGENPVCYSLYHGGTGSHKEYFLLHENGQLSMMPAFYLLGRGFFTVADTNGITDLIRLIGQVISCDIIRFERQHIAAVRRLTQKLNFIVNDLEYHLLEVNRSDTNRIRSGKKIQFT